MSSKALTSTVNSDEINYLVFRYLQESGYVHSAFAFGYESHVNKSKIDGSQIPPGALLSFVQRGVNFVEIEESLLNGATGENGTAAMDGVTSLLDVHKCLVSEDFKRGGAPPISRRRSAPSNNAASATNANSGPADNMDVGDGVAMDIDNGRDQANNNGNQNQANSNNTSNSNANNGSMNQKSSGGDGNGNRPTGNRRAPSIEIPQSDALVLRGHASEVFVCTWNPSSNLLASASGDSTARIWPIPNYSQTRDVEATAINPIVLLHPEPERSSQQQKANDVTTLSWNPAGTVLATGCYDGCARLWGLNGSLKHTLKLHKGPLFSLKWNKSGNRILSGSVDASTAVWDGNTGKLHRQFKFHSSPTLDVDWKDENTFASCSTDEMIYLCHVDNPNAIETYEGHKGEINCLQFDPSGTLLASCSDDYTAKVWSEGSKPLLNLEEHYREVYTLQWANRKDQLMLATASFDASVKLWDINTGKCIRTLADHTDPVYSLDFSPNSEFLATGSFDRCINIWSVKDGTLLKKYRGDGGIFEVNWNPKGDRVAACFSSNTVTVLDVRKLVAQTTTI